MKAMASKPYLFSHVGYVWTGYQRLSSCRPLGPAGVGPIPWSAIDRYCERIDASGEEYDYFLYLIEHLDQVFLENQPKADTPGKKNRGAGK